MIPEVSQLRANSLTMGDIYGQAIGRETQSTVNDTPNVNNTANAPQTVAMSWVSFVVVLVALRIGYELWMKAE